MICHKCSEEIPRARLEACPGTRVCVKCSDVQPYVGFQVFPHKTGGHVAIIKPEDKEALRQAQRAHRRSR